MGDKVTSRRVPHIAFALIVSAAFVALVSPAIRWSAPNIRVADLILSWGWTFLFVLGLTLPYGLFRYWRMSKRGRVEFWPFVFACTLVAVPIGYVIAFAWLSADAARYARENPGSYMCGLPAAALFMGGWIFFLALGAATSTIAWLIRRPDRDAPTNPPTSPA